MIGHIAPLWDMDEIRQLPYFSEPFNDINTVNSWTRLYGREFSVGEQSDFRMPPPSCQATLEKFFHAMALTNFGFSWYRMRPGDIIPRHVDTYINYCRHWQVRADQVVRILVLLEDWQPGYLLEVENQCVANYTAGTFVYWTNGTPHMAGNLGSCNRYSLQITATMS